jgi:hypothetical protein
MAYWHDTSRSNIVSQDQTARDREPDKTLIEKGTGHKGCLANKCTLGYPSSMAMSSENERDEING